MSGQNAGEVFQSVIRLFVMLSWINVGIISVARANVTFSYIGNDMLAGNTNVGNITMDMTFADASGSSSLLSYSVSAEGVTLANNNNSCGILNFGFSGGQISQWLVECGSALIGAINSVGYEGGGGDATSLMTTAGGLSLNAANSSPGKWAQAGSSPPLPPPGKSSAAQQFYSDSAKYLGLGALVLDLFALTPCDGACAYAGISLGAAGVGFVFSDPPDFNYTTVALPITPQIPAFTPTACVTPSLLSTLGNLSQNTAQILGLQGAVQTAFNRADGAYQSNALSYEQLQLNAAYAYIGTEHTDVLNIADDINNLSTQMSPCLDPSLTAASVQAFQALLAADGFSASDTGAYETFGLTATEISLLVQLLDFENPMEAAGNYPQDFQIIANDLANADLASMPEPGSILVLITALLSLAWLAPTGHCTHRSRLYQRRPLV